MAEFLNTNKLKEQLIKILETAEKEVVLISPYIQTNPSLLEEVRKADNRGVTITIVFKEGKLSDYERKKLIQFKNINLLSHPNLHSKCYYNEIYLVVTSMNLYDYSQRNNREMGILFRRTNDESKGWSDYKRGKDDDSIFQDAIFEIKNIISGAEVEKEGETVKEKGFEIQIAKTNYDLTLEKCNIYNKYSKNKKFLPFQSGEDWYPKCENFVDHVDLVLENKRALIHLNFEEKRCAEMFEILNTKNHKGDFDAIDCFRMYWTYHKSAIYLYPLNHHELWDLEKDDNFYIRFFSGLNEVFKKIKPSIEESKK